MVFLATKSFTYHNKYSISDGKKTSKICDLWQTFFLQNLHFLVAKSFSLPVGSGRLRVPETPGAAPRKQMAMNLEAAERRYKRTVATYFQQSQAQCSRERGCSSSCSRRLSAVAIAIVADWLAWGQAI